jgi:hypothetical protein
MLKINDDLSIYLTRGDSISFSLIAEVDGVAYIFRPGDVVRFTVYGKKAAENVVLQKDFPVEAEQERVIVSLADEDTKIGEVISKPTDYWYEIELIADAGTQTIVGYDEDGPKVFKLYPEGEVMA